MEIVQFLALIYKGAVESNLIIRMMIDYVYSPESAPVGRIPLQHYGEALCVLTHQLKPHATLIIFHYYHLALSITSMHGQVMSLVDCLFELTIFFFFFTVNGMVSSQSCSTSMCILHLWCFDFQVALFLLQFSVTSPPPLTWSDPVVFLSFRIWNWHILLK